MGETLRTLLVGVGARGKIWSRLLADEPLTETVGYVDIDPGNLAWAADRFGATPEMCFATLEAALEAARPDLVLLATPPMDRFGETAQVFDAGAHLLSEKPLTLDFDEGIRIVEAAEAEGLAFAVGLNFRYQHCVRKAKEIFASGELGAPSFSQYVYWRNRDGRRPGLNRFPLTMRQPMLYEQTIHHVDEIRYAYGRDVRRVWCRCHNPPWSMYRDDATVVATLELDDDLIVNYFGTWSGQTKINDFLWRTDCDEGALAQFDLFADLRIARGVGADEFQPIALPTQEPLVDDARLMLSDVARQILAGNLRPHPSGIDHLKTFGIIAAMEESNRTGRPVEMAAFFAQHDVPRHWLELPPD
jgi:predicted dehydrogenase